MTGGDDVCELGRRGSRWDGEEVGRRLKSGCIRCLMSRAYCEFKISSLFCFSQSCIDLLHDNLQGSFIEMPRN